MNEGTAKKHYGNLDGLRAYSAIGIVILHVFSNGNFEISGLAQIGPLSDLVFLFMTISAFSMCCGYYEKLNGGNYSLSEFYKKRYAKILPFFSFLVFIDLILSHSLQSLYEAFADITLVFGLLPNPKIEVIGVGWFLGVIFVFYMLFPFFACFMLKSKFSAWLSFAVCAVFNVLCQIYFFDVNHMPSGSSYRNNIIFCAVYFVAGGIIYLYREQLAVIKGALRIALLACLIALTVCYYVFFDTLDRGIPEYFMLLLIFSLLTAYAVGVKNSVILSNPITKLLSSVSMEIYLCHMLVFRVCEHLNIIHIFGKSVPSFILTCIIVFVGALCVSLAFQKAYALLLKFIKNKLNKKEQSV